VITRLFHAWERRLASVTTDRVVRPFEWGIDWIPNGTDREAGDASAAPDAHLQRWVDRAMADSDHYFAVSPAPDYQLDGDWLTFTSQLVTPHESNNTVHLRYFRSRRAGAPAERAAVIVMPQWNADPSGHVGLCQLLGRAGLDALRLSLPYHDARMPPELHRADYIVSANVGRTLEVCRQAVLDVRRAVKWLEQAGYRRIGILGTSLGSCLALLAAAHEPAIKALALNHISPFFADVVWSGLSTSHVRAGLDGQITLEQLRRLWMPISPFPHLSRIDGRAIQLVYARYDLSFPVDLSRDLVGEFARLGIPHRVAVLPCGHYSTGIAPFSWLDGWVLTRFLRSALG
jgi:hypothetical protein|tara:strand:- start:373 stop:1407 length:1035 start_codon:yes stop_codon:yes gene_type:complete